MKGILLAGGTGSRLYPLTKVLNKHMLPVGRVPMIMWPLSKLKEVGIKEVMIITGVEHVGGIVQTLGSGKSLGLELTYRVQEESGGIAQALGLCREFVNDDTCMVILGDNIFEDSFVEAVRTFSLYHAGARLFLKSVDDPSRFGVAEVDGGAVVHIEEKPENPKSNLAVTGCYIYDNQVFDIIEQIEPSGRGELEITDVNMIYASRGQCRYELLKGHWTDAGTFESLEIANSLVCGSSPKEF